MIRPLQAAELGFFATVAGAGSLSAAARELGVSTAAVSKRLAQMEQRLGLALLARTTRRMGLTPEGELVLEHARRVASEVDALQQRLGAAKGVPQGLLRINATLGFGRSHVGPVIGRFMRRHPQVEVQLQLSANPPPPSEDAWDLNIRFGPPPDGRVVARLLARNRRLLCAAPAYLARAGTPRTPAELARHNCIGIRQGGPDDPAYNTWRLTPAKGRSPATQSVKVRGNLSTNDGEIAVLWALEGHGILMRAEWDVARHLKSGRLVEVLPQYRTPDADLYAVWPQRHQHSTRVRAFVDFVATSFPPLERGA